MTILGISAKELITDMQVSLSLLWNSINIVISALYIIEYWDMIIYFCIKMGIFSTYGKYLFI